MIDEKTYRTLMKDKDKIVVKIGTSTLSFASGRLNLQRIEQMAGILSTLRKKGKKIILVSSGAIGVGAGRLGLTAKPDEMSMKQALASIGQAELMKIYQRFFERHDQMIAQVLLTKDVMTDPGKNINAKNTLNTLMDMQIIPVINENDTISTDEILFGDNDTLSANVATLVKADMLVMLSDIDGLYSSNPKEDPNATIISYVDEISPSLESIAAGSGSSFGTGGMVTKIIAARICSEAGIDSVITNGKDPAVLYRLIQGEQVGTLFIAGDAKKLAN
ncbi:MAG: glutamate 5-kinase [Bacteroidota bacterium]